MYMTYAYDKCILRSICVYVVCVANIHVYIVNYLNEYVYGLSYKVRED